jgi:hypothetical protein
MSVPKSFLDRVLDLYQGKRDAYVFKFLYGKSSISVIYSISLFGFFGLFSFFG